MVDRLRQLPLIILGALLVLVLVAVYALYRAVTNDPLAGLVTTTVEHGIVEEIVSVSGQLEARRTAKLSFPSAGVVSNILIAEGDEVETGDLLASLADNQLLAERSRALANVRLVEAEQVELLAGPRAEARQVTDETVRIREANLARVISEQEELVAAARRTLLSSGLIVLAADPEDTPALAPQLSGTYSCSTEGSYRLSVYRSTASSGFSYELSGLEAGAFPATIDQPSVIGNCGLFIQFSPNQPYNQTDWIINIPNTLDPQYTANLNAYNRALENQRNAVSAAEDALSATLSEAALANADPRAETLAQINARLTAAEAELARIDADLSDRSIFSPFPGIVAAVDILVGETAGATSVITLLAHNELELSARIPEIDITKISVGQVATIVFDARPNEPLSATVSSLSPLPDQIDGVAYFTAKLRLTELPTWLRTGLNADIDIITDSRPNSLRLPGRFVTEKDGQANVFTLGNNDKPTSVPVQITFRGNDGFVAVEGLAEGSTVFAPNGF